MSSVQQSNSNDDVSGDTNSTAQTNTADDSTVGPGRFPSVRIILPGRKNKSNRLVGLQNLEDVIGHVLKPETQVDHLELLGMPGDLKKDTPGDAQYEHYLTPKNTGVSSAKTSQQPQTDSETSNSGVQLQLDEDSDATSHHRAENNEENNTTKAATGAVINALEEYLPEVDYQTGRLDLSSVADIPVPTSRLLTLTDQTFDSLEEATNLGALEVLVELINKQIPHLYQLLIKRASSRTDAEYVVTVRLAVFDEEYGIATNDDMAAHLNPTTSYQYDLLKPFREELLTSNFELPFEDVKWLATDSDSRRYRINGQPIYLLDHPFPIEQLATFREYNNLISGSFSADARYKRHFGVYGHIPTNGDALGQLAAIIPAYFEHSPWKRTAVAECPIFNTDFIPSSSQSIQRFGRTLPSKNQPGEPSGSTSKAHQALVNAIVEFLVQQGYTILAVDQDSIDIDLDDPDPTARSHFPGGSQPDVVAEKDGEIKVFEAEINDSNPAAYLKNLERAAHFGYPVVVVTQKADDLKKKFKQASRPFNSGETDSSIDGVRLYNFSEEPIETDEIIYLLPRGQTTTKWYLNHNGKLTLLVDGKELASGDPEVPLDTLSYATPRCRIEGGEYVVVSASGEHIKTFQSKSALLAAFTPIKHPFVPTQITYLNHVELRYKNSSTNELTQYYPNPDWARRYRDKPGRRHKASRNEFITTHTTKADGETLFIPDVRKHHRPWHTTQTPLDPPKGNWFARDIRSEFAVSDTETRDRKLLDRTWVYPPGLDPAFPVFGDSSSTDD